MVIIPDAQVLSESNSKFKLTQAFLVVLITCQNEEDSTKNESARVFTRAANSVVGDGDGPKFN